MARLAAHYFEKYPQDAIHYLKLTVRQRKATLWQADDQVGRDLAHSSLAEAHLLLANAYASIGQFDGGIVAVKKVVESATAAGDEALMAEGRRLIEVVKRGAMSQQNP